MQFTLVWALLLGAAAPTDEVFLGIVEVPALGVGTDPNEIVQAPWDVPRSKIILRGRPNAKAPITYVVNDANAMVLEDFGDEAPGVVVIGRQADWYRVKLRNGKNAWLPPGSAGMYHSYRALAGDWSYVPRWDLPLYPAPDDKRRVDLTKIPHDRNELLDLRVISSKKVDNVLWFEVQIIQGMCFEEQVRVMGSGWMRAHTKNGEHVLQFHTRGC